MRVPVVLILDLNADLVLDLASNDKGKRETARRAIVEAADFSPVASCVEVNVSPDHVRKLIPHGGIPEGQEDKYVVAAIARRQTLQEVDASRRFERMMTKAQMSEVLAAEEGVLE